MKFIIRQAGSAVDEKEKIAMVKNWRIEEMTGYHPLTTIYTDLGLAEPYGSAATEETINRVLEVEGWKEPAYYKEFTELVMALNWKIWEHHSSGNEALALLYNRLWAKWDKYACEHLKGEALEYYFKTTD